MKGMAGSVFDEGVGSKFGAAPGSPPIRNRIDQCARNTATAPFGLNIYAFEKGYRGRFATFNIVMAKIGFSETDHLITIQCNQCDALNVS